MMVGYDPSVFTHNRLGGYFLDWELSKKYFDEPDDYENIEKISDAIAHDKPDIIIDETGMMGPVADRIPFIGNEYLKEGSIYKRR
jgi:hypothetical protein